MSLLRIALNPRTWTLKNTVKQALANWINGHIRIVHEQFGHSPIASSVPTIWVPVKEFSSAKQSSRVSRICHLPSRHLVNLNVNADALGILNLIKNLLQNSTPSYKIILKNWLTLEYIIKIMNKKIDFYSNDLCDNCCIKWTHTQLVLKVLLDNIASRRGSTKTNRNSIKISVWGKSHTFISDIKKHTNDFSSSYVFFLFIWTEPV